MQREDELDLLELFSCLWNGKWHIVSTILLTVFFGGFYVTYKERIQVVTYESIIAFTAKNMPPFYDSDIDIDSAAAAAAADADVFSDFKTLFHSQSEFNKWKSDHAQSRIVYSDLSLTQIIDSVELASQDQMVELTRDEIRVDTNDLQLLANYHSYLSAINQSLTNKYVDQALKEKKYIEKRFKDLWSFDKKIKDQVSIFIQHTNEVRILNRYIDAAENGSLVFDISHPTPPVVSSPAPKKALIIALSSVLGGMLGVAYVLLRNTIRHRQKTVKQAHS